MVHGEGTMEWVDSNLGSKLTMKYPSTYLLEPGARGEILSMTFAGPGQHQDAGGKAIHLLSYLEQNYANPSARELGRTSFRGLLKAQKGQLTAGQIPYAMHVASITSHAPIPTHTLKLMKRMYRLGTKLRYRRLGRNSFST
jgi:hypothetical protein